MCTVWTPPAAGLRRSVCPSSRSWVSVSPVTGTWTYESSRSQLHSGCWYRLFQSHTHIHTHTQAGFPIDAKPYSLSGNCPRLPCSPSSHLPCGLTYRETPSPSSQATSHTHWLAQLNLHWSAHTLTCTPTLTPFAGTMDPHTSNP